MQALPLTTSESALSSASQLSHASLNHSIDDFVTAPSISPAPTISKHTRKRNMGSTAKVRSAALARDTNETKIMLALNLDGGDLPSDTHPKLLEATAAHAAQSTSSQTISVNTGIGFLDHMLHALAKHAGWSMALHCEGDLHSPPTPAAAS